MPQNKPIGLDLGKISVHSGGAVGSDDDLISAAMKQHNIVNQVLKQRQKNLKAVFRWWAMGNINSTINLLT